MAAPEERAHDVWALNAQGSVVVEQLGRVCLVNVLDATALWAGLDARRTMHNAHVPCRTLGGHAPLQAYPEAGHTGRSYRQECETELMDLTRVYAYLGTCRRFRRVAQN